MALLNALMREMKPSPLKASVPIHHPPDLDDLGPSNETWTAASPPSRVSCCTRAGYARLQTHKMMSVNAPYRSATLAVGTSLWSFLWSRTHSAMISTMSEL